MPTIVGVTRACGSLNTLIVVEGTNSSEHEARLSFMSQTGQLALKQVLAVSHASWCRTSSYRNDTPDGRHLRESELIEHVFSVAGLDDEAPLSKPLETIHAASGAVLDEADEEWLCRHLEATSWPSWPKVSSAFPTMSYDAVIEHLNSTGELGHTLAWRDDLGAAAEAAILSSVKDQHGCPLPVFITHYPTSTKFFSIKESRLNAATVLAANLLLPVTGKMVGAPAREDDGSRLRRCLVASDTKRLVRNSGYGSLEGLSFYQDLVDSEPTPEQAGYGIGLECLIQRAQEWSTFGASRLLHCLLEQGRIQVCENGAVDWTQ